MAITPYYARRIELFLQGYKECRSCKQMYEGVFMRCPNCKQLLAISPKTQIGKRHFEQLRGIKRY